ncbi:hypothetical protein M404DRAFT_11186 [Pisolithus tinctorius Marx 270]|uniref:Uncharacterized protein n=1 Tax=Pisolithus tinctorius Marx 270 TaxID=870435 RepID=A0A0C3JBP4_PISTI|nr:hypothetical protein M404DRAFT_11186 [Pisolithus tinctorius Marx 270]
MFLGEDKLSLTRLFHLMAEFSQNQCFWRPLWVIVSAGMVYKEKSSYCKKGKLWSKVDEVSMELDMNGWIKERVIIAVIRDTWPSGEFDPSGNCLHSSKSIIDLLNYFPVWEWASAQVPVLQYKVEQDLDQLHHLNQEWHEDSVAAVPEDSEA